MPSCKVAWRPVDEAKKPLEQAREEVGPKECRLLKFAGGHQVMPACPTIRIPLSFDGIADAVASHEGMAGILIKSHNEYLFASARHISSAVIYSRKGHLNIPTLKHLTSISSQATHMLKVLTRGAGQRIHMLPFLQRRPASAPPFFCRSCRLTKRQGARQSAGAQKLSASHPADKSIKE